MFGLTFLSDRFSAWISDKGYNEICGAAVRAVASIVRAFVPFLLLSRAPQHLAGLREANMAVEVSAALPHTSCLCLVTGGTSDDVLLLFCSRCRPSEGR